MLIGYRNERCSERGIKVVENRRPGKIVHRSVQVLAWMVGMDLEIGRQWKWLERLGPVDTPFTSKANVLTIFRGGRMH